MQQKRLWSVMALLCLWLITAKGQTTYLCSHDSMQTDWLGNDSSRHYQKSYHEQRIDQLRYSNYVQSPLGNSNLIVQQGMSSGCRRVNYIIPVVFHVVYDPNDSTTNISDAQVQNQMDALNDAFAGVNGGVNTGIQFCLAQKRPDNSSFNGINHIADSNPDYRKYSLQKAHLSSKAYYDRTRYLNIWVVKDIRNDDNTPAFIGGYSNISYRGGVDGVVMLSVLIGNYTNCSGCYLDPQARGNALVHEIGHWLGLEHTFAGGCAAGDDSVSCTYRGDRCCDTRPHNFVTNVCPTPDTLTCTGLSSYYDNTSDPIHNYMSYTAEYCKDQFTADQASIMTSEILLIRNSMIKIDNWIATNISCCNTSALFDANSTYRCNPDNSVILKAYPYPNSVHIWKIYRNDTLLTTHTDTANTFTYNMPAFGTYDVSHVLIYNSYQDTTLPFRINSYLDYVDCGSNIASPQANWTFGNEAALRFTSKGVFPSDKLERTKPNLYGEDNPICISDSSGNLLFYGQNRLFKRDYFLMDNSDMYLDGTPYQGLVSFRQPFYHNRYFVVSTDGIEGLLSSRSASACFRVVDTAAGTFSNGDVVTSRFFLKAPPTGSEFNGVDSNVFALEMLTAIPKCNGEDFWVLLVDASGLRAGNCPNIAVCRDSSLGIFDNSFKILVYNASSSGIDFHSVSDSAIGLSSTYAATLKFSPDGNWLAVGNNLYRFNRQDGILKFAFNVHGDTSTSASSLGGSFSPNSSVYYYISSTQNNYKVYQVDLNSSNSDKTTLIGSSPSYFNMQLAPNNKIYLSKTGATSLAVINYPDSICSPSLPNACGLVVNGQILTTQIGFGGVSTITLPNMVDAKKKEEIPLVIYHKDTACLTVKFSSSVCCANTFKWTFGDGDTSVQREPVHTYDSMGTYSVVLIADLDTIYYSLTLGINSLAIAGSPFICDTGVLVSYSLTNPSDYLQYTWSIENGTGSPNYTEQEFNAVWQTSPGTIKVIATDNKTGCIDSTSHTVTFKARVYDYNISTNQLLCDNDVPDTLIGDQPTGGFGYYNYQWYKSADTGTVKTWTRITGANSKDYLPPFPEEDTYYKRVTDTSLCPMTSNTVLLNRAITNNSILADTSDCDDIIGSTPNSVNSFTYAWQRSIDSTNWTNIPSQTGKDLTGPVYFKKTHVRRLVQDSLCTSYSNVLTIQPSITSPITTTTDSFCYGEALLVTGSTPCSDNSTITYQWQYKTSPSGDFSNIPVYYDSDNASLDEDWHFECELRRMSVSAGDTMLSDTLAVYFKRLDNYILSFEGFEPYRYAICSGSSAPGLVGSTICEYGAWGFAWESTTDTTDANSWQYEAGTPSFGPTVNTITKYYRRKAKHIALSDSTYTPAFQVYIRNPQITTQPGNATLDEGVNTSFHTVCLDLEPIKWQYGKVVGGSMVWTDLTSGEVITPSPTVPYEYSFDLVMPAELCLNGASFRAVYQNPCQSPGTYTYSNTVTLTVNAVSYDVWAKDYSTDVGGEPSTVSNTFIWDSPDIWNSRSTGITYHQNPEYRISDPNYIHAVVRNKGASTSVASKLYLYWTFASTGERWDRHWLNDTTLSSTYGNWRTYYGAKKPLGGLIGVYNVPTITSGNSWQMEAAWYAPDPGVLTGDSNTTSAELCFLARIVTCSTPDYGLTYPETYYTRPNVERNNNIVTKNFIVVDSLAGNGKTHWNGNGNPTDLSATGRLVFTARDCDYFEYGTVTVHLDNELQTLWVGNGANGSGFTLINDSTLQMDSCVMTLDDIAYGAETRSLYGIQFNERDDLIILENVDEYFEFDVQQYLTEESEENSIGGILYGVPVVLYPPEISGSQRRNTPVQDAKANQLAFSAFPNPFNDILKVVYSLPKDENVTITLTNLLGQTIQTVEQNEFKTAGIHRLDINTANLTEGIYFITFKAGNEIKQKKIVLIR